MNNEKMADLLAVIKKHSEAMHTEVRGSFPGLVDLQFIGVAIGHLCLFAFCIEERRGVVEAMMDAAFCAAHKSYERMRDYREGKIHE